MDRPGGGILLYQPEQSRIEFQSREIGIPWEEILNFKFSACSAAVGLGREQILPQNSAHE